MTAAGARMRFRTMHGVWLSRSLTFGSSAATRRELNQNQTEILRCPSPAGPQAAVGGRPLMIKITSSTAQGGGGSFKNRKPIGEVGCCESRMAERSHWWTERWLMSPLFLSLSLTVYLPTYLSIYLCIYRSTDRSTDLSTYLSIYLSTYLPIYLSI